jgi:hypothetical protein
MSGTRWKVIIGNPLNARFHARHRATSRRIPKPPLADPRGPFPNGSSGDGRISNTLQRLVKILASGSGGLPWPHGNILDHSLLAGVLTTTALAMR